MGLPGPVTVTAIAFITSPLKHSAANEIFSLSFKAIIKDILFLVKRNKLTIEDIFKFTKLNKLFLLFCISFKQFSYLEKKLQKAKTTGF